MHRMFPHAVILAALLAATPVASQQNGQGDVGKGLDLMQQGGSLLLRGLMAQMEPQMRALFGTLIGMMGDINAYDMPEVLPNGDIIIRRKAPLTPPRPPLPPEDDSATDL